MGFGFNYPSFSLAMQFNFGDISRKSPRVSQGDGAGSKWYGMLVCFFTADDEDLLDISLVALTNRRFYGNCTHVK